MTPILDPLTLPLTGSHLIEASAGTGKTYTIALLYLRLILGHRDQYAFSGGALTPPQILVVTFTEAATKELRDRIRARLSEAAHHFRDQVTGDADPVLEQICSEYAASEWPACAHALEIAAEWMDEAAVSTIHAWCNRMLREHAFDSLSLFNQNLVTNQGDLLKEVVQDYWREFYYPLSTEHYVMASKHWASPQELLKIVNNLIGFVDQLPEVGELSTYIHQFNTEKQAQLAIMKQGWDVWPDELQALFEQARLSKQCKANLIQERWYSTWLHSLKAWASSASDHLELNASAWHRLTPEGIREAWIGEPPDHPAFTAFAALKAAQDALPDLTPGLLSHAAKWVSLRFQQIQGRRSELGFDDLIARLDEALHGPNAERLAKLVRSQFPVALIDEFQDTDPMQFRIFDRIYQTAQQRRDCALVLIGDPKQAIYAFRGADIYTYLTARSAVGTHLYTLGTNYRSTQAMVSASNQLFSLAESLPSSKGTFLFRTPEQNPVPFQAVQAHGRKKTFEVEGQPPKALQLVYCPTSTKAYSKEAYQVEIAQLCAAQIVHWLQLGQAGKAGFRLPSGDLIALTPADITVLVNDRHEASQVRSALQRLGVRSVYLSDRDSVFDSPAAAEILSWLEACAHPENTRLIRSALASPSLHLSYQALDALNTNEQLLEERILQFKHYHSVWQQSGVLPMLRRLMNDFECCAYLLEQRHDAEHGSERTLTDLLHIAELLQQASVHLEGERALIRYLTEQCASPDGSNEEQRLRLESDAHLLKVITIHKSKGLEFPLVFAPYLSLCKPVKIDNKSYRLVKWHNDAGELQVSMQLDEEIRARAETDRLGEDIRKTYVAMTRAQYFTWVALGDVSKCHPNALDHLVGAQINDNNASYADAMTRLASNAPDIDVYTHDPATDQTSSMAPYRSNEAIPDVTGARVPQRRIDEQWWISSYSSLRYAESKPDAMSAGNDTPQLDNLLEMASEAASSPSMAPGTSSAFHRFPKGAEAGTFLHSLLEWAAHVGFSSAASDESGLQAAIERYSPVLHWLNWRDTLQHWIHAILLTPLPCSTQGTSKVRLCDLQVYQAEMEFWFEVNSVDLSELDRLVMQYSLPHRPRAAIESRQINGMLKGFIDLVFEHDGRYYVADYKSNWLGADEQAYSEYALSDAILAHRYELQYVIYLFALHRHLKARLKDYDYDRHIGGAVYLFLRGVASGSHGVHFERPPLALMHAMDALFCKDGQHAAS